jgi:hypothetical protein
MSNYRSILGIVIALLSALVTGCGSTSTAPSSDGAVAKSTGGAKFTASTAAITVVGDDTAADVAAKLGEYGFSVNQNSSSVGSAAVVVLAVDAPAGVRKVHRQLVRDLGKNTAAQVLWLFTRMSLIDDRELMDLQQIEAGEVFAMNGVPTANLRFAVDTENTTVAPETLKGYAAIAQFLSERGAK